MSSLANYLLPDGRLAFNSIDCNEIDIDDVPVGSGGGSGGGSVAGALAFVNNTSQTLPDAANINLILGTADSENTFGTTTLTQMFDGSSNTIGVQNNGSNSICLLVTGYCTFTGNNSAVGPYAIWINKNGNDNDRYGLCESNVDNDFIVLNFSCSVQLAPNDYINLRCWVNISVTVTASNAPFQPALRFIATQMNEGSGGGGSGGSETLQQVLTNGNNGGNLNMTNLNNITCSNLNVSTINNSAYPPSSGGGSVGTLAQVLAQGASAGNSGATNFSSIGFNNSGITTTIQAGGTSGILQVKNSSGTVGNVYDDTINPPPSGGGGSSVAQKSWINAPQTALQGNSPHSIHFTVSDASQSYNTGNFKITPVTVAGYTSGTYYCYQNSSSNPLPLSGSLNVSFSGTENTYLGLACCYIPANAVSNGTGNESFNPWINLINAIWSYYTGNQPGWQNITFNTVLQPNDYITFFALSNNNTAMCNPLPAVFGVPAININSRLTILQHL